MNNDMNAIPEKWTDPSLDEVHFPRMSTWQDQQESRLIKRILRAISRFLINLQCRLKALNPIPDFNWEEERTEEEVCS